MQSINTQSGTNSEAMRALTMLSRRDRYRSLGHNCGQAELCADKLELAANLLLFDVLVSLENDNDLTAAQHLFNVGYLLALESVRLH